MEEILNTLNWTASKVVQTRFGEKRVRNAAPTEAFWNLWRTHKPELKNLGYGLSKDPKTNEWVVTHWSDTMAAEEKEENLSLSRALSLDVDIPSPEGLDYLPFQKAGIHFAITRPNTLIADEMGVGKLCTTSTLVYTPKGTTTIGSLEVGEYVIGRDGTPTQVTGVYPQGVKDIYRVTFNDGFSLDVGLEHLWYVESANQKNKRDTVGLVLSTEQLLDETGFVERKGVGHNAEKTYKVKTHYKKSNGKNAWCIPLVEPIQFSAQETFIDPYLMGVMLGDGSFTSSGRVNLQIPEDKGEFLTQEYVLTKRGLRSYIYNQYKTALTEVGLAGKLSYEKFIPDVYKYNTVEVRLAVLQGLMDTDGHASTSSTEYSTSSERLAKDVAELVQTLGGIARVSNRIPGYTYKGEKLQGSKSYRVNIKLRPDMNPFRMERKAAAYSVPSKYPPNRYIVSIEKLPEQQEAVCIAVDAPDRLYVAEHCIVTHNTIQAAGVVNASPDAKRILVICPASLRLNWRRELTKWLVHSYTIGVVDKNDYPDTDIIIVNYDVIDRHKEKLDAVNWDIMIVDEVHYLKNPKAKRTKQVFGSSKRGDDIAPIPAKRRVFLTGTPILNRPVELFPIIHALDAERWPSFFSYGVRYCAGYQDRFGWDFSGASNLEELQDRLRSTIMIRRLKMDVLTELPPKRRQIIEFEPTPSIRKLVNKESAVWESNADVIESLRLAVELSKVSDDIEDYKNAVASLREGMTSHFTEMAALRREIAVAKVPFVVEHVRNASEKVVIFAHHKDVIRALQDELGSEAVHLMGDTKMEDRQKAVDAFQNDDSVRYFIGSIKAAGVGLTLTASSHVVFAELDWVPGNLSQAEDRLHRIGQLNSVLVQHLVLQESLDATMAQTIIDKQEVIDKALDDKYEVHVPAVPDFGAIKLPTFEQVAKEAKETVISDEEKQELLRKLRILAALDADHAVSQNMVGFNKLDTRIGHDLASKNFLSNKQGVIARKLVQKYRRQLEGV
jgi:hypothetical protein